MKNFFVWVARSPVRLAEVFFGVLLLLSAFLFSEGGLPSISLYGFGALLLFLTLYAYLMHVGPVDDAVYLGGTAMRRRSTVAYALPGGLVGVLAFGSLFPAILNSALLLGEVVALLLASGLVAIVVSVQRMLRR